MKTLILDFKTARPRELFNAALAVREGAVAVFPTDTVYGIGTCAYERKSVLRIYGIKQRDLSKPLPVFSASLRAAKSVVEISPKAELLAEKFWPGQLTLILPPFPGNEALALGTTGIGIRVPEHVFLSGWLGVMGKPLAQTSANLSGSPALKDERAIIEQFDGLADIIITGGTLAGTESTVLDMTADTPSILRRGAIAEQEILNVLNPRS
ncbi:MAG: L-threonylcarbamoyladenylate synthase [Elusimicrobiaceae bacterium]